MNLAIVAGCLPILYPLATRVARAADLSSLFTSRRSYFKEKFGKSSSNRRGGAESNEHNDTVELKSSVVTHVRPINNSPNDIESEAEDAERDRPHEVLFSSGGGVPVDLEASAPSKSQILASSQKAFSASTRRAICEGY